MSLERNEEEKLENSSPSNFAKIIEISEDEEGLEDVQ